MNPGRIALQALASYLCLRGVAPAEIADVAERAAVKVHRLIDRFAGLGELGNREVREAVGCTWQHGCGCLYCAAARETRRTKRRKGNRRCDAR